MDVYSVLARVDALVAGLAEGTPGWPVPRASDASPLDEEYSRCPDPAKYRVTGVRAEAWATALVELGLATVEPVDDLTSLWRDEGGHRDVPVVRAWRLRAEVAGTLPLLLCSTSFSGAEGNGTLVGAGDPAVFVAALPVCGCDACDHGSAQLLADLDEAVLDVVTGAMVEVRAPEGWVRRRRNGSVRSGYGEPDAMLADAVAGRSPYPMLMGAPWW
ncbi:MAG TPA: DUF6226 family protein [Actinomycetales bacterium]